MDTLIYLDNAATTKVKGEVLEAMLPYFTENYGNPSAIYTFAGQGKKAVDLARKQAAELIGAKPEEIYFTAGGSESDNWALKAAAEAYKEKGKHIITSKIEHHAILHTCGYLEKQGFEITYLNVDSQGKVSLEELREAIRPDTILISVMMANNEIGTLQDVAEIGKIAREAGVLFHTDAVQACGHIPVDVEEMNVDMLSASGHKFYGPKGVGVLYIKKGVKIRSFIHGGAQERNRRAGTLNVPGIVGFGKAAELAGESMVRDMEKVTALREHLIQRVLSEIPYSRLNGHKTDRLPGNASFCFRFIEGESMLILLDQLGVCASSGSACTSGALDPSHVLLALGLPHEIAHGSLRLTLSEDTKMEEIDFVVDELKKIIGRLRDMSPLYEDFVKKAGRPNFCDRLEEYYVQ
ncbi:MAG: cysteine desulfurase NifS [Lachnospiraceae bacterium]|nr:cysteine desulfurase NifS [Lachnospiraceae bacterium]